ncbi:GNAT family N-acetyltransferase [Mesobacillus subterraneus]|uniref:GNAT family N-acetyltransferase n=1 Tax=Mesobacillus subterraneus TaxID=285983 RepID=UPI001CFC9F44|nr:GNAT family N-acetyltransferase [Mesobacillus subterraneus]WLR57204.1 GNAT family N-acetyltransferase [Mesobacillus subterraneus]
MIFQNGSIKIRRLKGKDKHLLAKWLSTPEVLQYYEGRDHSFDLEKVDRVFYASDEDEVKCMIEYEDKSIGYIQYYELDEATKKDYGYEGGKIFGTDQFIGEIDYWDRGIGTLLVTSMTNHLFEQMKADKVVMDPQVWNERAIKCYEKCGFKKVKLLPKHELHEGKYRDCWLLESKK